MLNDFDLIRHSFENEIDIYPIADVHLGALEHSEPEWQAFLKRVETEDAYIILAGDLINNATRGTKFANPFEEVLRPREAKRRMVEYLKPLAESGKLLCIVGGNHEARTARESDQDISYDICAKLNVEHLYRESMAFMCIGIGQRKTENKSQKTFSFCITHGTGGGYLTGTALNKGERFGGLIEGVDCIVTAHVHKGFVSHPAKIVVDPRNNYVSVRPYLVLSCVPWLNYGGYAARAMLNPAEVCKPQKLHLHANSKTKEIITTW